LSLRGGQNGRRGNPSCLGIYFLRMLFIYCGSVDRRAHKGLAMTRCEGGDDKGGVFTMKGMKKIEVIIFVIARRERSEGRGNPSCVG